MKSLLFFLIAFSFPIFSCYPDTITFKNGKTENCDIIERTDEYIKLDFYGVPLTYPLDAIERIEEEQTSNSSQTDTPARKENDAFPVQGILKALLSLRNPETKLIPSHVGHPGYENLAFLYDQAVMALILKTAKYQKEAEDILDYFVERLKIPLEEIEKRADTNGVYGILKLFKAPESSNKTLPALINAIDISSTQPQGKGMLEFYTTPGPTSFLIFALLHVNEKKYRNEALLLGKTLLAMQKKNEGVIDGDRSYSKVHTEPHMDCYAAFLMLYQITGEKQWKDAAEEAYRWFKENVYFRDKGVIDQGIWQGKPSDIFAEDVYSWTMAGPAGDRIGLAALERLTETMLRQCLVRVSVELPYRRRQTVILCDFTNPALEKVKRVRNGYHPLGSIEWTGGAILALQKNAVRFWDANIQKKARFYKALANVLFAETKKCFYPLNKQAGLISFYATGQGIMVGPFGSLEGKFVEGWRTPFFYAKSNDGKILIKGGSPVSAWPLLAYMGVNPFILNDSYQSIYEKIPCTQEDMAMASSFVKQIVLDRNFEEAVPTYIPDASVQLVEPGAVNKNMWQFLEKAYAARERQNYGEAKRFFEMARTWAEKTLKNRLWQSLAQRDNALKQKEVGGIIDYPWGQTYPDNNHPLHFAILRYPLLNEIATAMWGLSVTNFELGNRKEAKYWMVRIIEEVPLHQIPDVQKTESGTILIKGYWNALISWEDNAGGHQRDALMGALYQEVLKEKGLTTAKPKVIILNENPPNHGQG